MHKLYAIKSHNMFTLLAQARTWKGVIDCYPFGESHHIVANNDFDISTIGQDIHFSETTPTIEDVFIQRMKQ